MKKNVLLLSLFSFLLTSLLAQKHNVIIEGQFIGYDNISKCAYTLDKVAGTLAPVYITPDSLGHVKISLHVDQTSYFRVGWHNKERIHAVKLIVSPGMRYTFVSEGEELRAYEKGGLKPGPVIYSAQINSGDGFGFSRFDKGQVYYNMINNDIHGTLFNENWNLQQPQTVFDSLQIKIERDLDPLNILLVKGELDPEFYNICKLNIEYMYAERLASSIMATRWHVKYLVKDSLLSSQLNHLYVELFERFPVEKATVGHLNNMRDYTDMYLEFLEDYNDGVYNWQRRKGNKAYKAIYDKAGTILPDEVNQRYQRYHMLCYAANLGTVTQEHIKKYLQNNPELKNESDIELIEEVLLPRVEEYEALHDQQLPKECVMIPSDSINSFKQLSQYLDGKSLLIDCWGSWCIPCRAQFQFMVAVKEKLKERGICMVYLAYEYSDDAQLRESIMKSYQLAGYHVVANDSLKTELKSIQGDNLKFPTFMIVDGNGDVVCKDAPLASDMDALFLELDKWID